MSLSLTPLNEAWNIPKVKKKKGAKYIYKN